MIIINLNDQYRKCMRMIWPLCKLIVLLLTAFRAVFVVFISMLAVLASVFTVFISVLVFL